MTHLDLFSGIGGFKLAAQWAGYETVGFSEICPYASKILKQHWPHIKNYGDVKNIKGSEIGEIDLITGGFPCQPFSVAGKKLGDSDARHLWPELARILSELRPRFALFENVPGLLSISGGRVFNGILSDLSSIGYDCIWNLVPACAVGANHQRDRIWIVAVSSGKRCDNRGNHREARSVLHHEKRNASESESEWEGRERRFSEVGEDVADSTNSRLEGVHPWEICSTEDVRDSQCQRLERSGSGRPAWNTNWWSVEPDLGRVAHGIPNRMDRLKCLGNAIVPQVAYQILKAIVQTDEKLPSSDNATNTK